MKITYFILITLLVAVLCGCSKDEEATIKSVALDKAALSLTVNDTYQFVVSIIPSNLNATDFIWTTSNSNIVSVNEKGIIAAVSVGRATITVYTGDKKFKSSCTVDVAQIFATGISFNVKTIGLSVFQEYSLSYTISPSTATKKQLKWSSADSTIATVDNTGKVKAINIGTTNITIKTDNNLSDICTVTINPFTGKQISQDGKTCVVNVPIAGTLSTLLTTAEIASITDLTVLGNIDARDFKCMCTGISNLTVLDISRVIIQAYNGASETSSSTKYPANELPAGSGSGKLENIILPNSITSIGGGAFKSCSSLTSMDIPNSVTLIGDEAFYSCTSLTSLRLGNSVTSIGINAFAGCGYWKLYYSKSLTSIILPNSVISIGGGAFSSCIITSMIIPNSVTSIEGSTFSGCFTLTSVTIGKAVTSIGTEAFQNCSHLASISVYATNPPKVLSSNAFTSVNIYTCVLHVPIGTKNAYQAAPVWGDFKNIVEMAPD